jgi:hypothetical protein
MSTTGKGEATTADADTKREGKAVSFKTESGERVTVFVPLRIKRAKLARAASEGVMAMLDCILSPEDIDAITELPTTGEEWDALQALIFNAAAGVEDPKS